MATSYKVCPSCNQSSTVEFWDNHTRDQEGISASDLFTSAGADKAEHDRVQSYYRCPICNEEVDGSKLKDSRG